MKRTLALYHIIGIRITVIFLVIVESEELTGKRLSVSRALNQRILFTLPCLFRACLCYHYESPCWYFQFMQYRFLYVMCYSVRVIFLHRRMQIEKINQTGKWKIERLKKGRGCLRWIPEKNIHSKYVCNIHKIS